MTNTKIKQEREELIKELGIQLEELIDKYGIEAVVNILGSICEYRGNEMLGVKDSNRNARQLIIGKKYLNNAKKLQNLDSFNI